MIFTFFFRCVVCFWNVLLLLCFSPLFFCFFTAGVLGVPAAIVQERKEREGIRGYTRGATLTDIIDSNSVVVAPSTTNFEREEEKKLDDMNVVRHHICRIISHLTYLC